MTYLVWGFNPGTLDQSGKAIEADSPLEACMKSGLDSPTIDLELDMEFGEAIAYLTEGM